MKRVESLRELLDDPPFRCETVTNSVDGGIDHKVTFKITHGDHLSPLTTTTVAGNPLAEAIKEDQLLILEKLYGRLNDIISDHVDDMPEDLFNELNDFFGGLL